jgi:hypothetical protein
MMKYKKALTPIEVEREVRSQRTENRGQKAEGSEEEIRELVEKKCGELVEKNLLIKQWDLDFLEADLSWCGQSGSPTKVHRIQSVVLAAKESKSVEPNNKGISDMVHELIEDKTIA